MILMVLRLRQEAAHETLILEELRPVIALRVEAMKCWTSMIFITMPKIGILAMIGCLQVYLAMTVTAGKLLLARDHKGNPMILKVTNLYLSGSLEKVCVNVIVNSLKLLIPRKFRGSARAGNFHDKRKNIAQYFEKK